MRKRKNHPLKLDDQKSLGEPLTKRLASNVLIQARKILGSQAFSSELEKLRKFIVENLFFMDIKKVVQEEFSNLPRSVNYPVHTAVFQGKLDDISRLVEEKKSSINEIIHAEYFNTPLQLACCINNADIVRFLLSLGASLDTPPGSDLPIIYYALRSGNLEIIELLIEKGVPIIPNNLESLALYYVQPVLRSGEISLIKYLFEKWIAAENETAVLQSSVLLWIAGVSNEHCLAPLLPRKAFDEILTNLLTNKKLVVNYVMRFCPKKRLSALHQQEKLLLSNWLDDNEETVAHWAVYWSNRSAVQFLLEHHRDLFFKKNKFNNTPISLSTSSRLPIFKLIDELPGAEAQLPEGRHWSHLAAMNGNLDVLEYLYIKNPDSLKLRDNQGKTPIVLAVENGNLAVFRFIVREYKESIEWKAGEGETIVHKLIQAWSDTEPLRLLQLRQLALFDEIISNYPELLTRENHDDYPPIAYAAGWECVKLLEKILQRFPDLYRWQHATSRQTLIHQAARFGCLRIIDYFKENYPEYTQSTLSMRTSDGYTPLVSAAVNGQLDIFQTLGKENKEEVLLQTKDKRNVVHEMIRYYDSDKNGQNPEQKKLQEMLTYIRRNYSQSLFTQEDADGFPPIGHVAGWGASHLLLMFIENDSKCHNWRHPKFPKYTLESHAARYGHVHLLENFKKRGWLNLQNLTDFLSNRPLEKAIENNRLYVFEWYQNNIPKEIQFHLSPSDTLNCLMIAKIDEEKKLEKVMHLAMLGRNHDESFKRVAFIDHVFRKVDIQELRCVETAVTTRSYWFLAYLLAKKIAIDTIPENQLKKELQDLIDSSARRFLPLYFHLCYVPKASGYAFPQPVVHIILDYAIEYAIHSLILCVMKEEKPTTLGKKAFYFQFASHVLPESPDIGEDVTRTIIQGAELLKFEKSSQTQAGLFSKSTESSSASTASTSIHTLIP